jgi:hypothetical protein
MSESPPNLLRAIDCPHEPEWHRTVSDCVIYRDIAPGGFLPQHEIARQVIVCTVCGSVVEVRDVDRDVQAQSWPFR